MKKEYTDYVSTLEYINSDDFFKNDEEEELISRISDLFRLDKTSSIVDYLNENNVSFRQVINEIDKEIERLSTSDNLEEENCVLKKADLTELKENILYFMSSRSADFSADEKEIIDKCLPAIDSGYRKVLFFGEELVSKEEDNYKLNSEAINRTYSILGDSILLRELTEGLNAMDNTKRHKDVLIACTEALNNKENIYEHRNVIIEYNSVNKKLRELREFLKYNQYKEEEITLCQVNIELNKLLADRFKRFINSGRVKQLINKRDCLNKRIEKIRNCKAKYYRLLEEKEKLESILEEAGLLEYLRGKNSKGSNIHSLSRKLPYIYSYDNLDNYYAFISSELDKSLLEIHTASDAEKKFFERVSPEAKYLLDNENETCRNIVDFGYNKKDGEISPAMALFILKGLVLMRNAKFEDKDISLEEIAIVESRQRIPMQRQLQSFLEDFRRIRSNKTNVTK